jgi:hypothetical protein
MVVLCTTSQLLLFALAMVLVDVVAGVTSTPILVEFGMEVVILGSVHPRLFGVVLIDLLLYGGEVATRRSIGSTARMAA